MAELLKKWLNEEVGLSKVKYLLTQTPAACSRQTAYNPIICFNLFCSESKILNKILQAVIF